MESHNLKRTALFECHVEAKAKIVPFSGWEMPLSYEGSLAEHQQVRTQCGIFDVSHMGEIFVSGPAAVDFLQFLTINDVSKLAPGQGQYSALLTGRGGMVDDLILYRLKDDEFLLCVNAGNIEKDHEWIASQSSKFDVKVTNDSERWSQVAVQGPLSTECLAACFASSEAEKIARLPYMTIAKAQYKETEVLVARTGYTGEKGYEIYMPNSVAQDFWRQILTKNVGKLKPIGLGARDSLRLEACYLLYGSDMDETVSPLEAGISWAVKLDKPDFLGKQALVAQKEGHAMRKMIAFTMEEKAIARHGMEIYFEGQEIGRVTSGGFLPTLGLSGGMGLIYSKEAKVGDSIEIDIRGKRKLAKIVKRPLYSANVK
jgi:aminomethyltransferase